MVKTYADVKLGNIGDIQTLKNEITEIPSAIVIYHPDCGHCKSMKNTWKNTCKNIQERYSGNLNLANVHTDVTPHLDLNRSVNGFPHIIFKNKDSEVEYTGQRNEQDFEQWILNNSDISPNANAIYFGGNARKKQTPYNKKSIIKGRSRGAKKGKKSATRKNKSHN